MERRNYRKVYLRLWRNPNFHALDEAGKLLALYLLAGPQTNRIGLFRVSVASACEDTDMEPAQVRAALEAVCAAFGWQWDARASVVLIPSWWDYNGCGDNEKAWKGTLSDLNDVPRTTLVSAFAELTIRHRPGLQPALDRWIGALKPDTQSRPENHVRIPNPSLKVEHSAQSPPEGKGEGKGKERREKENTPSASVSLSPPADPFNDPTITERAGRFIERYEALYEKHRKARYLVRPQRDYHAAVELCRTWADDTRLDKIAAIFLTTDHKFAEEGSRTIPQFAALASWADSKLAEWEAKQGVA
jgi:hypothetical protein